MKYPAHTQRPNARMTLVGAATAMALLVPALAHAQFESTGYFRAGPGATKKNTSRACYALGGAGMKYRLGNECDFYGEFLFTDKFKKDNMEYSVNFMPNLYSGGTDDRPNPGNITTPGVTTLGSRVGMAQMFVEGKGFDFAPGVTFWAGKAYVGRADVHIVDTQYIDMSGVGAGARDIALGGAKLGVGYFRNDGSGNVNPNLDNTAGSKLPASRLNVDVYDIAVNPNGKLRIIGTATKGDFTGGKSGYGLTGQHIQKGLPAGLINTFWLQYAQGSASLNSNFGSPTADSDTKSVRVIDSVEWQSGPLGGQAQAMFQNDRVAGADTKSATVGGRVSYGVTRNFKLVSELGFSQIKPDGSPTAHLTKFTFAPTISSGPDFWNRPELRLYVTTAKWNGAANTFSGSSGLTGIGDGKTSGTSFGAQVEVWW